MKPLIGGGFIILTLISYGLLLFRLPLSRKAFNRAAIAIVAWMGFLAAWSLSGVATRFDLFPLNMAPVLVIPFIAIIIITIKSKPVLAKTPVTTLVNLQVFRVVVEIFLWVLASGYLLPDAMTFEGRNWDILSGLTAPLAAIWLSRSKWGLALWNVACLALLANIVTVAIYSMPVPFQKFFGPSSRIVAEFPFILLPGMLVPLAYGLSLLSLRQIFSLTSQNEETPTSTSHRSSVQHN